jgi:hypothetical protein
MQCRVEKNEEVSHAVIQAVSDFEECAPTSLPPLQETIDIEALNRVFDLDGDGTRCLSFAYSNSHITIHGTQISLSTSDKKQGSDLPHQPPMQSHSDADD